MGYDLHITRKDDWADADGLHGPDISLDEWKALVDADPQMELTGVCDVTLADGRTLRHDDPSIAVWRGWSHDGEASDRAWFVLRHGNVTVKNPDREIRRKMWQLARRQRADVQGDDGEFYDRFGNPAPDTATARSAWRALVRHLGFAFTGDPVGGDIPPRAFARFPTIDSLASQSPQASPHAGVKRVLNVVVPKGSGTPEQWAAIEAARAQAKRKGIDLTITEL